MAPVLALIALAGAIVRALTLQPGLLIPDGYQYLLMARGIGEHLRPITTLGPAGSEWAPNADAAWKPLYPALIAVGDLVGLTPRASAELWVVLAGGGLCLCAGGVVWRCTRHTIAAAAGAGAIALSEPLVHWHGFLGPDALAPSLAAGAAERALARRPLAAGALGALAALARPEWGIVVGVLGVGALARTDTRREGARALLAAAGVYGAVMALLRPPLAPSSARDVALGILAVAIAGVVFGLAVDPARGRVRTLATGAGLLALVAGAGIAIGQSRLSGLGDLARAEPVLVAAGIAGAVFLARRPDTRWFATSAGAMLAILGAAYLTKNPDSERYLSMCIPVCAVIAAVAIGHLGAVRARALAAAGLLGALALTSTLLAPERLRGADPGPQIAAALPRTSTPLIVATPEAISVARPDLSLHPYAAGARGTIISDPISRDFADEFRLDGTITRRIPLVMAVRRRDGALDAQGVVVIEGVVRPAR